MGFDVALPDRNEKALSAVEKAHKIIIATMGDYLVADEFCVGLKEYEKEADATFDDVIKEAFQHHRSLIGKKNRYVEPIQEARKIVKGKMVDYRAAEEKRQREAEALAREAAIKAAEEQALRDAEEAEKSGDKALAETILAAPIQAPAVVLKSEVPKSQTVLRKVWKFRVSDSSRLPREYLCPDMTKIGSVVRALKDNHGIAGVEAWIETC